ncbi:MAG: BREX-1 system adenine-specific DNA-methyltransferase PglX [Halomonas sp.]|nr:BREX-1 system adenine-specific DNA-methyltransferase PglX [Halomonas sp.]MBR2514421.1 BREX-1 system adenine-specific DNA-methyltransferase PglX [Halomonas sp.]
MAFDQATRGRLRDLVNDCRKRLTEEFTLQLQQDYGLDPKTGEVTELERLTHLSDRERHTATLLRETLAHYLALAGDGKSQRQAAIDRIIREQAFTVLNRLAALLMMEARGLLLPAVSQGTQSQAFELYRHLAGTALGETGEAYQTFLFSLFDEFAIDLPALFDRFAPQGRLFPRETALNALLELLNDHEIGPLWALDETIGWIYQYFNSQEERKAMRKASQAPRNSRELAVRNQFFTPRYVVEFLVDNTLGRQWFNATGGTTPLRDSCQYLLVKPDEQPEASIKLRDPRTLKLLDPACGSMHFGLYAFDLFLQIYRDAWQWEKQYGPGTLDVSTQPEDGFEPLCHTYSGEKAFLRDVPRLIIEHNIYGVDIDPRAAQIASLALWLRAQRAWHEADVKAQQRPDVGQGNVIAAVAPPAEKELRVAFMARLDSQDAELFEKTLQMLKGLPELGILLRAEKELPALIRQVYVGKGIDLFAEEEQETWQKAEKRLRHALVEFSDETSATYQSRLFAQDALQGLRMIDLCRETFDVVVMNPPFGESSKSTKSYLSSGYPVSKNDIYAAFLQRGCELLSDNGKIGAITNKTGFLLSSFAKWRERLFANKFSLLAACDLGFGVLDSAMVETMMYVVSGESYNESDRSIFIRAVADKDKSRWISDAVSAVNSGDALDKNIWLRNVSEFSSLPSFPICYWVSDSFLRLFKRVNSFSPSHGHVYQGIATGDNFRFLRCAWEVCKRNGVSDPWVAYAKGGESEKWVSDLSLRVNWFNDGAEIKENARACYGSASRTVKNEDIFFKEGVTYTQVTVKGFFSRALPKGCVFDMKGPSVQIKENPYIGLGVFGSMPFSAMARIVTDSRQWHPTSIMNLPFPDLNAEGKGKIKNLVEALVKEAVKKYKIDERSSFFVTPFVESPNAWRIQDWQHSIDEIVAESYGVGLREFVDLDKIFCSIVDDEEDVEEGELQLGDQCILFLTYSVGVAMGRFDWRLATGEREAPPEPDPFEPLPTNSPGMLPDSAEPYHRHAGILVDDSGHEHDLPRLMADVLQTVDVDVGEDLRYWLRRDFFKYHLQQYSKSRRKAPIYWPLATASGSYTLWLYYPDLTDQTLFTAVNDFLDGPNGKLTQIEAELANLRSAGANRSHDDEKRLEELSDFRNELADLRDMLLELAPGYKPNHDDGVQITAAPLWALVRHKPWQKVLKETWDKLEQGDYDWAHLAMAYWPERVREKCITDKSLAIAHDLEHLYAEPEQVSKKTRGRKKNTGSGA